jgi:NADH:ubiquinone oxidoreductase subunit F (NADH-binding)
LKIAVEQARQEGFLGNHILDSDFSFDLDIFQGAGAFVCGESTALVRSIEGKRGIPKVMPRSRTTEEGLWNKPTLLNNVKTFANIPLIITNGAGWFTERH